MDDFKKLLEEALKDEEEGVEFYSKLANECWEHGHIGYSQILSDIASEELMHAKHIIEIMKELNDE